MRQAPLFLLLALAGGTPASAQLSGRVDVGVGGAPLGGRRAASHWALAPTLRVDGSRLRFALGGEYRGFGELGYGTSGSGTASWFAAGRHAWRLELTGDLRGQGGRGLADRAAGEGGPRWHLVRGGHGFWLGTYAGADAKGPTFHWEAAWWRRWGAFLFQFQGRQSTQSVTVLLANPLDTLAPFPDSLVRRRNESRVLTSLGGWLTWQGRRVEVRAAGGVRLGLAEPGQAPPIPGDGTRQDVGGPRSRAEGWWQAEAAYWISDRVAIASTAGRQPGDASLLTPGGTYLRMSLRAALGRRGQPTAGRTATAGTLRLRRVGGQLVEISLPASGAAQVELMGDFTDWRPVRLDPDGHGNWRVHLPVEPGLHRINVRYDGGAWRVPPGTRAVPDEFGVLTGEIVVG